MSRLYALILAGGSGTRLWPVSRQSTPKQIADLGARLTLLQETVRRLQIRIPPERMVFVTSEELAGDVRDQLRRYMGERARDCLIVGEPASRNTAPAILLGTRIIQSRDPQAIVIAAPSDHVILDNMAFAQAMDRSISAAAAGMIVTYGVKPTRPETGYGYIKAGKDRGGYYQVERFEEKPDLERAEEFLRDPSYSWNSGIFFFSAGHLMEEGRRYLKETMEALEQVDPVSLEGLEDVYAQITPISIDHGIMEKTRRAAVIPVSMGWSDLGSWDSFYEMKKKDKAGNVVIGDVTSLENEGCLLLGAGNCLAVSHMKDAIVVQVDDATLVCPRGRSQDVRTIVQHLEKTGRSEAVEHPTVRKPWGSFKVLEEGPRFKVKRIVVEAGQMLSLQMHMYRSEHWVVVRGEGTCLVAEEESVVGVGDLLFIPPETKHRAQNNGDDPFEFIEVQLGSYLGEDDIIRYEDAYGRVQERSGPTIPDAENEGEDN